MIIAEKRRRRKKTSRAARSAGRSAARRQGARELRKSRAARPMQRLSFRGDTSRPTPADEQRHQQVKILIGMAGNATACMQGTQPSMPSSSPSSRASACSGRSPASILPPGNSHRPASCCPAGAARAARGRRRRTSARRDDEQESYRRGCFVQFPLPPRHRPRVGQGRRRVRLTRREGKRHPPLSRERHAASMRIFTW